MVLDCRTGLRVSAHCLSPDELDSYMFQTVGHEGVALYAAALGLPLFQEHTQGHAVDKGLVYSVAEGDEVEDLFQLLRRVKVRTRGPAPE